MQGNADGSKVWFDPIGVLVQPGQTIRRPPAIPAIRTPRRPTTRRTSTTSAASPRGPSRGTRTTSLPNETFAITLTVEGVYDYFCLPHEMAGMVGRIIVGRPAGFRILNSQIQA